MKLLPIERQTISVVIIGTSIAAWIFLLFNPGHIRGDANCHITGMGSSSASLQMMLMMNPISGLITGWALMVVAMMFPKLILPVQYIYARSLKSRRFISAILFVFGYTAVWMAAGIIILAIQFSLNLFLPNSYLPLISIGVFMIIWQFSPAKQYCLNRGHEHPVLPAFGWPASREALFFGIKHGLWCLGAGWALMFFPMLLPEGHHLAMAIVTFIMLSEHAEHPRLPRWQFRLRSKLTLMLFAQTRIAIKKALD